MLALKKYLKSLSSRSPAPHPGTPKYMDKKIYEDQILSENLRKFVEQVEIWCANLELGWEDVGTLVVQMFLSVYIGCSAVYDFIFYDLLIHDRRVALLSAATVSFTPE